MLELSKYITNYTELLDLGVRVLHFGNHQVHSAYTDFPRINEAAYNLLQTWSKGQHSPNEAKKHLDAELRKVNLNQMAHVLTNTSVTVSPSTSQSKTPFVSLSDNEVIMAT